MPEKKAARKKGPGAGRPVKSNRPADSTPLTRGIGRLIRKRRAALGLTIQAACARTAGRVTTQLWSRYENGNGHPHLKKLAFVAYALACSLAALFPKRLRPGVRAGRWDLAVLIAFTEDAPADLDNRSEM